MGNLLKSDLYRLFKSKSFYVCMAVAALLMAGGAFLNKWALEMAARNSGMPAPELPFKNGIAYGLTVFSSGDIHLFMAILIAIYITSEFTHGTMKNVVSKGFSKIQIYISKLIAMSVATYTMLAVMLVFGTIAGFIVTGTFGETTADFVPQAFRMIGIELLLHTALASVFVMIAMIIRNGGATIAVDIIGVFTVAPLIYSLLDWLFDANITQYSLQNNIQSFNYNFVKTGDEIIRSILVGLIFLVATAAIGMFAFKNTDVK